MTRVTEGTAIRKHSQGGEQQKGSMRGTRTGHIMLRKRQTMKGSEAGEIEREEGCSCELFMLPTYTHSAAEPQDKREQ